VGIKGMSNQARLEFFSFLYLENSALEIGKQLFSKDTQGHVENV
jgi:hypothetical protein